MRQEEALLVLRDAGQDRRITATLGTKKRTGSKGYTVNLSLRRGQRVATVGNLEQWASIKEVWQDL